MKLKSIVSKEYTLKTFSTDKIDNYLELLNSYKTVKEYAKSIKKLKKKQEVLEEEYRFQTLAVSAMVVSKAWPFSRLPV